MNSQGSTFSWGGAFGQLTGITFESATAELVDATGNGAQLRGDGHGGTMVIRDRVVLAVDPGGCQVKFIGAAGLSDSQVGTVSQLSVGIGSFGAGGLAALESFSVEASVGDLVRCTANFRFL